MSDRAATGIVAGVPSLTRTTSKQLTCLIVSFYSRCSGTSIVLIVVTSIFVRYLDSLGVSLLHTLDTEQECIILKD